MRTGKKNERYLGNYFYTLALVRYNVLSEDIQCYARTRRFIAENNTVQLRL